MIQLVRWLTTVGALPLMLTTLITVLMPETSICDQALITFSNDNMTTITDDFIAAMSIERLCEH